MCKRKQRTQSYAQLERRCLLALLTVDIAIDNSGATPDGRISLREAVIASNTNAPYGDAPAGDAAGDEIVFAPHLAGKTLRLGSTLEVTEAVQVRGYDYLVTVSTNQQDPLFFVNTNELVIFSDIDFNGGTRGIVHRGGGTLRLTDTVFSDFRGASGGAAVDTRGGDVFFLRSELLNNDSIRGGAVTAIGSNVSVTDSLFENNSASKKAGAIYFQGGNHTIVESDFQGNSAGDPTTTGKAGGAISISEATTVRIFGGEFRGNSANVGGAIESSGQLTVRRGDALGSRQALFHSNQAIASIEFVARGGAIYNSGSLTVSDAFFQVNRSHGEGGSIHNQEGQATIVRTSMWTNQSLIAGGAISARGGKMNLDVGFQSSIAGTRIDGQLGYDNGVGGALAALESPDPDRPTVLYVFNSIFDTNVTGTAGGGIYVSKTSFVDVVNSTIQEGILRPNNIEAQGGNGAGIYSEGVLRIKGSQIHSNFTRGVGGGIHIESGFLSIADSTIAANGSSIAGGGISMHGGRARVENTIIGSDGSLDGNVAATTFGDERPGFGGGVSISSEAGPVLFRMIGGQLSGNTARLDGGGIHVIGAESFARFEGVLLNDNSVTHSSRFGGAIYNRDSRVELKDSEISDNLAGFGGGIYNESGIVRLVGSNVTENAARKGGGIYDRDVLLLVDSIVESNVAATFADIFQE